MKRLKSFLKTYPDASGSLKAMGRYVTAKWFVSLILTTLFGFQAHGVMNQSLVTKSLIDSPREIFVPPFFMEGEDASILLEGRYDVSCEANAFHLAQLDSDTNTVWIENFKDKYITANSCSGVFENYHKVIELGSFPPGSYQVILAGAPKSVKNFKVVPKDQGPPITHEVQLANIYRDSKGEIRLSVQVEKKDPCDKIEKLWIRKTRSNFWIAVPKMGRLPSGQCDATDTVSLADQPLGSTSDEVVIVYIRSLGNHFNYYLENLY